MATKQGVITLEKYFMDIAKLTAKRSSDPNTQVGACLVNKSQQIIGLGYNDMPKGCPEDAFPWSRDNDNPLETKYPYIVHAEANAILNAQGKKGDTLYTTLFPCHECAKLIIQAGIKKVVYDEDKYHDQWQWIASRKLLQTAGISYDHITYLT